MKNCMLLFVAVAMAAATFGGCDILAPEDPGLLVPRTVDEDSSLPSIVVNGTQLHAETFGNPDDPIIVVIHGGPGEDYRSMLHCSRFSSDGFFVVFYDQRGTGLSKRHPRESYGSIQIFIDDLDAVIKNYRRSPDQKVILMGHSWGAMLATAYVNEHPGAVNGMVLMEPGGLTWKDTEEQVKRVQGLALFDETSNDYVYLDQILTGDDHIKLDYKASLKAAANFSKGNREGNAGPIPFWRRGAVCHTAAMDYARDHGFDFTTNLRQYTTNVLFLYSELNEAYGQAYARRVSSAYPHVQLVEIAGTGHEMVYFGWDRFYPVARVYLDAVK